MKKKPIKIVIYVTVEQKASLDALHEKTGAPVAELIRRSVNLYLSQEAKKKK